MAASKDKKLKTYEVEVNVEGTWQDTVFYTVEAASEEEAKTIAENMAYDNEDDSIDSSNDVEITVAYAFNVEDVSDDYEDDYKIGDIEDEDF